MRVLYPRHRAAAHVVDGVEMPESELLRRFQHRARVVLEDVEAPTRQDVTRALSGNLCRCTGYYKIVDAVLAASGGES